MNHISPTPKFTLVCSLSLVLSSIQNLRICTISISDLSIRPRDHWGVCVRPNVVVLCWSILRSLWFHMQHCHLQKRKSFNIFSPPNGLRVCVRAAYVLPWCSALHSLLIWCHVRSEKMFWPFEPTQEARGCARTEYVLAWCSIHHLL